MGEGGEIVFLFFYRVLFSLSLGRHLDMTEILLTGKLNKKKKGSVYSVDLELSLNPEAIKHFS